MRSLLTFSILTTTCTMHAQWLPGGSFSTVNHYQAAAFHQVDTGLVVYGSDNPANGEGGILKTWTGLAGQGGYIWYQPGCNIEDIDLRVVDGFPYYMAAGHQGYNYSLVLKQYLEFGNYFQFDSVRTGTGRHYRAIRMRNDLVAFAAGGTTTGDGIIDMSTDTGATWSNIAVLPGQPVSRLHFVNDQLGFATTGGYRRLINNGVLLPDSGAIYRTLDGGLTWSPVHQSNVAGFSDVHFLDAFTGVATRNDGGILRTTDGGETWNPATVNWPGPYVMSCVTFRPDGTGFAGCYRTDGASAYILSTDDGGLTWGFNFATSGLNNSRRIYDLYFFDNALGYALTHIRPLRTDGLITNVRSTVEEALELYPNPSSDLVKVRLPMTGTAQLTITDACGRALRSQRVQGPSTSFSVHDLPAGVYVVCVASGNEQWSARLVCP